MKKLILFSVLLTLLITLSADVMTADRMLKPLPNGKPTFQASHPMERENGSGISWEMPSAPSILLNNNYYDYMIGSYCNIPVIPQPETVDGHGWFYTFMSQPSSGGNRRVYYGWMNNDGQPTEQRFFTNVDAWEGYQGMDVDDLGHMILSWHSIGANDVADVRYGYDSFFASIPGIASDSWTAVDNPVTHNGFDDNEYMWPSVYIGPSPLGESYNRVYIMSSNSVSHSVISETSGEPAAVENVYISFADYTSDDLDFGNELVWTYTSIPTLDAWNTDTNEWRRPNLSFIVGTGASAGKVFYIGTHLGDLADGEPSFDVFIHDDYCNPETDWRVVNFEITMPLENPVNANGNFLFVNDETNEPWDLHWDIVNTSHFNVSFDALGRIHMPATYAILTSEDSYFYYFHNVKDMIFNPMDETLQIVDVFPKSFVEGETYIPWDMNADGEPDQYWDDGTYDEIDDGITPDVEGYGNLKYDTIWPFQHWDADSHEDAMFFNLNHLKITDADENGVMAMLWLDSTAGRDFLADNLSYWEPYDSTPEIYISISGDNGHTWREPIALSGVDVASDFWMDDNGEYLGFTESHEYVPAWDGMTTMYAYPGQKMMNIGVDGEGNDIYRLFIMFHNDDNWGSSVIGEGQAGPGQVIMNAIDFHIPPAVANNENTQPAITNMMKQNYPNPFGSSDTNIEYTLKNSGKVNLSIYNIKGQLVKTLVDEMQSATQHQISWNGIDTTGKTAPSGVYFYRLRTDEKTETRKMIKIK
ncbi:MAG: T9SS type A sorting domain-containing protein [Candidatus Cloacimonetes bacterium]|nr:T9SS type A sorting domain-containing protein [Candidatus Cloacimonadota bacterium]